MTDEILASLLQHIATRCWSDWWIGSVAQRRRCHLLTRARLEPLEPVGPPAALMAFGALKPLVCTPHRLVVGPVASALSGRIDDAIDIAPAAQHKAQLARRQFRDAPRPTTRA